MKNITFVIMLFIIHTMLYNIAYAADNDAGLVGIWAYRDLVTDSVNLNHKQNNLRIMLKFPTDVRPDSVVYRYQLDGYDTDWRYETDGPWIYYTDLTPGSYRLVAQCKIKGGNWGEPIEHTFNITKPWWLRWPAMLAYALITTAVVVLIIVLAISRIRLSNQMRVEKANQKFRNELILHATRKFRTPLVVIKSIIENLNDQQNSLSQSDVRHLRNSSRTLMQMVEELSDYGRVTSTNEDESDTTEEISSFVPANADIKVMIISPHNTLNNMMCKQMQAYFTVSTSVGNDAYEVIKENNPHAIVLDTDITETNAYALIEKLKSDEALSRIPIILISPFDNTRSLIKAIRSKADDYLPKPFNVDVLATLVVKKVKSSAPTSAASSETAPQANIQPHAKRIYFNLSDKEFLQKLNLLIDEHIDDSEFNVASMAKELAISRITLCDKMKNLCGMTPVEYLRDKRLIHAAHLLNTTDMNVNEIREKVGITDATYFHRRFKEKFSVSPRLYRQNTDYSTEN